MGRYDLSLTENGFWGLTLRELNALIERHKSNQDWLNYRSALICAVLANTVRDPKKKVRPFVPDDFMPREKPGKSKKQTTKQMLATVKMLNAAYGKKAKEK